MDDVVGLKTLMLRAGILVWTWITSSVSARRLLEGIMGVVCVEVGDFQHFRHLSEISHSWMWFASCDGSGRRRRGQGGCG